MPRRDRLALLLLAAAAVGSLAATSTAPGAADDGGLAGGVRLPGLCVNNLPEPGDRRCVFVEVPLGTTDGATVVLP